MMYQGTVFTSYNGAHRVCEMYDEWSSGTAQQKYVIGGDVGAPPDSLGRAMLCGMVAGTVCTLVVTPMDAFKVALQVRSIEHKTVQSGDLFKMVREGQVRPYKGLAATVTRDLPSTGVYFYVNETLRRAYGFSEFNAGGLAGVVSWFCCAPIDTIKTRIQASRTKMSVSAATQSIYAEAGLRGFARGLLPLISRAYPVNGVTFTVYSWTSQAMREAAH
eukprot:TRINITY_DN65721_c0_g1_i1.p1 TRINITY_DN65721_c0_g1~~TRINITY_DN65721_c0_g1_i1.p1  ORF type:complete len:240 (+),score=82.89 TRINITY_DN65721_c0_g1_i1:68-721(+)